MLTGAEQVILSGNKNAMTNEQKKEWAELLFTQKGLNQKEVAAKVGTTEKTMSKWVERYGWKALRDGYSVTRGQELHRIKAQLTELNDAISERDKGERYATTVEADILIKLTAAMKNLETEVNLVEVLNVCSEVVEFIRQTDLPTAQLVAEWFDEFIKHKLKGK